MLNEQERGQVVRSAAQVYEDFFVPALFGEWAVRVTQAARVKAGDRVLDVGCGTGVLARHVAGEVGPGGSVVGIDVNEGMLEVAARLAPRIEWQHGRAEALPFEDEVFNAVVSQFAAMFFEDRVNAVREMVRTVRPGGRIAVAVWGPINSAPGYADLVDILESKFGPPAGAALRAPFTLGEPEALNAVFREANVPHIEVDTLVGTARFGSIRAWMHTDIRGWTLADMINDDQFESLVDTAEKELARHTRADGTVAFDMPAHVATVERKK